MSRKSETNHTKTAVNTSESNGSKISAKKRKQSSISSPEIAPNAKKNPLTMPNSLPDNQNKPVTFDEIVLLLSNQTKSLQESIQTELTTMRNEINAKLEEKLNQMNDKIETVKTNVQSQLDVMKTDIANIQNQPNINDDDYMRFAKSSELKIKGIEHSTHENLNGIIASIANIVGFDINNPINIPTIVRPYKLNPITKARTPAPIVIIKFIANHIRDEFYSLYLGKFAGKQQFMSEHIGLSPGNRIIIGESLTQPNYSILYAASQSKREGKLVQVFTQKGLVHIRINKMDKPIAIRSIRQLEILLHQMNPTQSAHQSTEANTNANR